MQTAFNRRQFLRRVTLFGTAAPALHGPGFLRAGQSPNSRVRLAVMGCNGRGLVHLTGFLDMPNVEIVYVCDVDRRALDKGVATAAKHQARAPRGVKDIRQVLDDPSVDAISIATPNHWHAPATILACAAGKHVYVEKPGSHNPHEAELMVAAARKYRRRVQMGNQRRSWPWVQEAIHAVRSGEIGPVRFAHAWYNSRRGSIGRGQVVPVPEWLDYTLWQGPAPDRPYKDNILHYKWHWFWHWGNGELGNNGIHLLDLARWGLDVDLPRRITCGGNRYHFEDDQETPDTYVVNYDFGNKAIAWVCQSCHPRGFERAPIGVIFYGQNGALVIAGDNARIYDLNEKLVREIPGKGEVGGHFANFVDAIRQGTPLRSEIEEAQKSTLLCHLGNLAWRTGGALDFDPATRKLRGNERATALWQRDYRPGWEPKV